MHVRFLSLLVFFSLWLPFIVIKSRWPAKFVYALVYRGRCRLLKIIRILFDEFNKVNTEIFI